MARKQEWEALGEKALQSFLASQVGQATALRNLPNLKPGEKACFCCGGTVNLYMAFKDEDGEPCYICNDGTACTNRMKENDLADDLESAELREAATAAYLTGGLYL